MARPAPVTTSIRSTVSGRAAGVGPEVGQQAPQLAPGHGRRGGPRSGAGPGAARVVTPRAPAGRGGPARRRGSRGRGRWPRRAPRGCPARRPGPAPAPPARRRGRGRQAVGDHERRAALHDRRQRRLDLALGGGVDRRRRLVEDQDARVGDERPRDGDALALAARERVAALADDGVEALGQRVDELLGLGHARGAAHLLVGRLGAPVGDVLAHGGGEQERVLRHDADLAAQLVEAHAAHVGAVHHARSRRWRRSSAG